MPVTLATGRSYYVRGGAMTAYARAGDTLHSNRTARVVGEENGMFRVEHGNANNPTYLFHYDNGRTDRFSMTEFDLMAEVETPQGREVRAEAARIVRDAERNGQLQRLMEQQQRLMEQQQRGTLQTAEGALPVPPFNNPRHRVLGDRPDNFYRFETGRRPLHIEPDAPKPEPPKKPFKKEKDALPLLPEAFPEEKGPPEDA